MLEIFKTKTLFLTNNHNTVCAASSAAALHNIQTQGDAV